jgi:amidase
MSASGLTASTYETLAAHYRAEVMSKLPRRSILAPSFIASFPPGSDITSVPETCGVLSEREVSITRMNVVQLVGEMGEGRIKAVEVVEAFGVRAAIAHQLVRTLYTP